MAVTNVAELNALVERVKKAQREYASFTQEQVDKIFRAAALAANNEPGGIFKKGILIIHIKIPAFHLFFINIFR